MTKILLVEDDKSLREIYGVRLLAEGYDIISAGDGEEALALAIKDRPSLIVSDVMMPKISGFDMLDILRSTTETKDIKVIMMTALSSEDQRARGEQLGADRYLVKSQVGIEDVVRTVHEVLGDMPGLTGQSTPQQTAPAPQQAPTTNQGSSTTPLARPVTPSVPDRPSTPPVYQPQVPQPQQQPTAVPSSPQTIANESMPQQPQPGAAPIPSTAAPGLPQPTAPFSTPRPTGLGLSDRVINPLPKEESTGPDLNSLLEKELAEPKLNEPAAQPQSVFATPSEPTPNPTTPTAPEPPIIAPSAATPTQVPANSPAQPASSDFDFEETPRTPQTPNNPFLQQ